jgi:Emfourin
MSMQIIVRRTGGYTGGESVSSVETGRLDAARRNRIEQLVRDAAASLAGGPEAIGSDLMRYEITVRENGTTRSLAWTDDGSMGPVRELIEEVRELSS